MTATAHFPDLCVNGKQVLSENIADLAGLLVAHDAYVLSLKGKTDVVIGGLSGEQRFFLAFAQRWRKAQSEAALRRQIATDTPSARRVPKRHRAQCRSVVQSLRDRAWRQTISEARRSRSNMVMPLKIAFVEWPENLSTEDPQWVSLRNSITAARPDILVTNELPFGPWLAEGAGFRRTKRNSASAHMRRV